MKASHQEGVMPSACATRVDPDVRSEQRALLQSARFRLMIELGRGSTPMRVVNEAFDRAAKALSSQYPGDALVAIVEQTVRAEFAPARVLVEVA